MPFRSPPTTPEAAETLQYVDRGLVAALSFLLYDILLTFDDEVHLFWRKKWSFMKFNFFFSWLQRYQGPVLVLTIISCDLILLARIYILYFDSKYVQQLVSFSFILEIIGACIGLGLGIRGMRFNEICVVVDTPHGFLYYAGAIITFQTILFGLTLYKFIEGVRVGWGNVPIVKLVMRDGTWAFFTLFVMMIGLLIHGLDNPSLTGILYPWVLASYSFSGYRILLNINHLSRQPHNADISGALSSNFDFKNYQSESPIEIPSIPPVGARSSLDSS